MTPQMDHARCSELLLDYLENRLNPDERAAVAGHLDGCPDCAGEHRALMALRRDPGGALSPAERDRLHAGILATIEQPQENRVIVGHRGFRARLAPALAAAATLVALVAGGILVSRFETGSNDQAGSALQDADESGGDGGGGGTAESAPKAAKGELKASTESLDAAAGDTAQRSTLAGAAVPIVDPNAGAMSRASLRRLGHRQDPFTTFAATLFAKDAPEVREDYLAQIVDQAPDDLSQDFESCARVVFDGDDTAVPAYGALGTYERESALALGFVSSPADRGRLDRYQIWVWPRGDCSFPRDIFSGKIRPQ